MGFLDPKAEESTKKVVHRNYGSVVLVPQPSHDVADPLNWSLRKKYTTLTVVCFATFAGTCCPIAHQAVYVEIAPLYHKPPIALSYSISAAVAGLLAGPMFFIPLARLFGRTSVVFWSLLGAMACQIWAAKMTHENDYIPFVISRWMAGMFAAVATVIGSGFIMDIFFLHQRSVAFTCYELSFLLGIFVSPTLGGFIVKTRPWPYVFWWTLGPVGLAAILVFCFLQETGFARGDDLTMWPKLPTQFWANRMATLFFGQRTVPKPSLVTVGKSFAAPFVIGLCPAVLIADFYMFIAFGFTVMLTTLLTIYLQTPVSGGGYSFTPYQNAAFTTTSWVGLVVAQLTGTLVGDRLPLYASKRLGRGIWHSEYRLWNMFLPSLIIPLGLGIFGAGVQYHLHYMVLALGVFLTNYAALLTVPVCINYAVESFDSYAMEAAIIMGAFRLAFGIVLPFFAIPWQEKVGIGWLFGTAAFLSLFASLLIALLAWKGSKLRRYVLWSELASSEEGALIVKSEEQESGDEMPMASE